MKRLLVSFAATLLLAGLVVGVPWLLLQWGRLGDLSLRFWAQGWSRPDDGTLTTALLTLLGWGAWVVLTWSILAEVAHQVSRGRFRLRLPGTSWLSPLVTALVAAALAPLMSAHAAVPELPTAAAATAPAVVHHEPAPLAPGTAPDNTEKDSSTTRWRSYTVGQGDELWDIAARELGGGERWREIVAANPDLDPGSRLIPGTVLRLPATITVTRGDTLWDLAEEHLGDPEQWPRLHEANQDLIADPDEIDVGWTLTLPGTSIGREAEEPRPEPTDPPTKPLEDAEPVEKVPASEVIPPSVPEDVPVEPPPVPEPTPRHADPSPGSLSLSPAVKVLGPVGALLGAGLMVTLLARRRIGLAQREPGRCLPAAPSELSRHWAALGLLAAEEPEQPSNSPAAASVLLGWDDDQAELWCDLEARALWLEGPGEQVQSLNAALLTSLLCAEWSHDVEVVVIASDQSWGLAVDDPRLTDLEDPAAGLAHLEDLVTRRLTALGDEPIASARQDPDRAGEFAPTIYLFCAPVTDSGCETIAAALARGQAGVSVVAPQPPGSNHPGQVVRLLSATRAELVGCQEFTPQLLRAPARRAIAGLFTTSTDQGTLPAPWWCDDLPQNITQLPSSPNSEELRMPPKPSSPTLLLLGETQLVACDGERPSRSVGRCLEACAWLLANPGCTPTQMREGLMIAEGTRRSVVSRLRGWLGRSPTGEHLPDAYSGKLRLAETVSSDWERFQSLLAGGVNRASETSLIEALALVRGAPLSGYEFQWGWAESIRCDMISMIVDAAVVLAERCLARQDLAGAEWALGQGALTGSDSEALAARRILLRAAQGDRVAVDQEVLHLTRTARTEGRDLTETTVRIIQKALSQSHSAAP